MSWTIHIAPPGMSRQERERHRVLVMSKLPYSALFSPPNVQFDDTGCNPKFQPYFTWAGYFAPYSFWDKFANAWGKTLDRRPKMDFWHQTDRRAKNRAANPKNPFYAFSEAQLERKERALCSLIADNRKRLLPLAFRVSHADIQRHVAGKIHFARRLTRNEAAFYRPDLLERPHLIALMYAAKYVTTILPKNSSERMPVSFFCETRENDPYQAYFQNMWNTIATREPLLGNISFVKGKVRDAGPIQAADILAWHVNFRAVNPTEPDDRMWSVIDGPELRIADIDADSLREHVNYWNAQSPRPLP